MPYAVQIWVGPRNHVLSRWAQIPSEHFIFLGGGISQPIVKYRVYVSWAKVIHCVSIDVTYHCQYCISLFQLTRFVPDIWSSSYYIVLWWLLVMLAPLAAGRGPRTFWLLWAAPITGPPTFLGDVNFFFLYIAIMTGKKSSVMNRKCEHYFLL